MAPFELHKIAQERDVAKMREALSLGRLGREVDLNQLDRQGYSPLMRSVMGTAPNAGLVKLLLDHGADVRLEYRWDDRSVSLMRLALGGGNPEIVDLLLQKGADLHYRNEQGYDALLDAVHHRDIPRDESLIELLHLLIAHRVELNTITDYRESGLRVLSRLGRFDAVQVLLDAGADPSHLKWTPLMRAVAIGSIAEVRAEVAAGASLEEQDWWERTPWLLALQTGDTTKALFLYESGANTNARGRCGKPPLFYAIESNRPPMLRWLLETGALVDGPDEFGQTPLMLAVENSHLEAVDILLEAGADLHRESNDQTALSLIRAREIGHRLLAAGADPRHLSYEAQRVLLGFNPDTDDAHLDVTIAEFREAPSPRFGVTNPEQFHHKFWEGMIRSGIPASRVSGFFDQSDEPQSSPVWCAKRFGQSITFLPDHRIVQIGGEHEDSYDSDFCIYNDVFVHHPDGSIDLFGYPEGAFPPTDFHTATLLGDGFIWIIGSLGYAGTRLYGKTSVHRLNTTTMRMERIETSGQNPGWIHKHTADLISPHEIRVSGGLVSTPSDRRELHTPNSDIFTLDTGQRKWRMAAL